MSNKFELQNDFICTYPYGNVLTVELLEQKNCSL